METLKTFFSVEIIRQEKQVGSSSLDDLKDKIDLVLGKMRASEDIYIFKKDRIIRIFFKCDTRKRRGQLVKACETHIDDYVYSCYTLGKDDFYEQIEKLKNSKKVITESAPVNNPYYTRSDIKIFDNRDNWYEWQKQVYDILFEKNGVIKQPDPRKIISILDKEGNHGKSSFFKYLLVENQEEVGRLGYGTAAQLRSRAMNMGIKKVYIIDLARTKSREDSELDLLSTIEDLKSGVIVGSFYGRGDSLIMDPPAIVISSNYEFDYKLLSKDRWLVFEIKNKKPYGLKRIKDPSRRQEQNKNRVNLKKELGSSQDHLQEA